MMTSSRSNSGNLVSGLELFPKHQLNLWEKRCLETHNKIRYAYGIDSVRWNTLFSDLAKDRAFNTLTTKKSSSGLIRRPLPLFQAGDVIASFSRSANSHL